MLISAPSFSETVQKRSERIFLTAPSTVVKKGIQWLHIEMVIVPFALVKLVRILFRQR